MSGYSPVGLISDARFQAPRTLPENRMPSHRPDGNSNVYFVRYVPGAKPGSQYHIIEQDGSIMGRDTGCHVATSRAAVERVRYWFELGYEA